MALPIQSLNFVAASSQQLALTDANFGAFNKAKFAISCRVKRASTSGSTSYTIMTQQAVGATDVCFILRFNNDRLDFLTSTDGTTVNGRLLTSATFTSTSDWISILIYFDSANATAADRIQMYTALNGASLTRQTAFTTNTNPSAAARDSAAAMRIGNNGPSTEDYDGTIWQLAFFSGTLPSLAVIETAGAPNDLVGATGLWSILDVNVGGSSNVTHDGVLATAWTNTNTVTASNDTPFRFESAAITAEDGTLSATCKVKITTSSAAQEDDDTLSGTGKVRITTAANIAADDCTMVANARVKITATTAAIEENDSLSAAAFVKLSAAAAIAEEDDALNSAAQVKSVASLAATEENDTLNSSAQVKATASFSATEENDTLSANSYVKIITSLNSTEESDALSSAAKVKVTGSFSATAENDSMNGQALARISMALTATEENDILNSQAGIKVTAFANIAAEDGVMDAAAQVKIISSANIVAEDDIMTATTIVIKSVRAYISMVGALFCIAY